MILLDMDSAGHARTPILAHRKDDPMQVDRDPPAEKLAKAAVSAAISAKEGLDAELFSAVRVGLMLSSGRPGVKRVMFVLTDRLKPKRTLECSLLTAVRDGDFVLTSDCRGQAEEVARVAVADTSAPAAVRKAVERFVLETVERFSNAASH